MCHKCQKCTQGNTRWKIEDMVAPFLIFGFFCTTCYYYADLVFAIGWFYVQIYFFYYMNADFGFLCGYIIVFVVFVAVMTIV